MPRAPDGTVTLPAGNPVVTGTAISSSVHNATMTDIATMLEDSLSRTGNGGMASPFPHADGSSGAPGITFDLERGSGLFRSAAETIGLSVNQVVRILWTNILTTLTGNVDILGATSIGGDIDAQANLEVQGTTILHGLLTLPLGVSADIGGNLTVGGTGNFTGRVTSGAGYAGILASDLPAVAGGNAIINDSYVPNGCKVIWDGSGYTVVGVGNSTLAVMAGSHTGAYEGVCGFSINAAYTVRGVLVTAHDGFAVPTLYMPGGLDPYTSSNIPINQFYVQLASGPGSGVNTSYSMMFWYTT